jgi:hypothetical protein
MQLGRLYTTLTSSLLVLWWIYPIGEWHMRLAHPAPLTFCGFNKV